MKEFLMEAIPATLRTRDHYKSLVNSVDANLIFKVVEETTGYRVIIDTGRYFRGRADDFSATRNARAPDSSQQTAVGIGQSTTSHNRLMLVHFPVVQLVGMVNTGDALLPPSRKLNNKVTAARVVFEGRSRRSIQNHRPS